MPNLLESTLYHMYPFTSNTEVKTLDKKEIELNISSLVAIAI